MYSIGDWVVSGGLVLHSASCAWIHDFAKERDYQVVSSFDIDLTLIDARLPTAIYYILYIIFYFISIRLGSPHK